MALVNADIWVLTETHLGHAPSAEHRFSVFSPPHPDRRPEPERWTAIWSRWPLTALDDPPAHRRGTVAAIVETPSGPLIVYGTVLAWANEPHFDDGRPARMWEVHHAEAERQAGEWAAIAAAHPGIPLLVAGDFNQDRDGSGWYGTPRARRTVSEGLDAAGLVCVTEPGAVSAGWLQDGHLIDHICVSTELAASAVVHCWAPIDAEGQRLSDHPTVAVDL